MSVPVSVFWSIKWDNHHPLCGALRSLSNSGKHVTGQYLRQGKTDKSSRVTLNRTSSRTVESLHLLEKGYAALSPAREKRGAGPVQRCSLDILLLRALEQFCVLNRMGFFPPAFFFFWLEPVPSVNYTAEARFLII